MLLSDGRYSTSLTISGETCAMRSPPRAAKVAFGNIFSCSATSAADVACVMWSLPPTSSPDERALLPEVAGPMAVKDSSSLRRPPPPPLRIDAATPSLEDRRAAAGPDSARTPESREEAPAAPLVDLPVLLRVDDAESCIGV